MIRKLIYIILILNTILLNTYSQGEISLKIEPDTNIIRIGEQIDLSIQLKHPENINIKFPQLNDYLSPELEIMEMSLIDTVSRSNSDLELMQHYKLTSFDTGFYQIPPLPFEISLNNRTDTFYSKAIPLMVFTMQLDTTNRIFDIKPQYPMKFHLSELLNKLWIYIVLLVILITGLLILYFEKRKNNETGTIFSKPKIPAHVIALKELDELKREKLWQQNKTKEYYSRLTDIIRHYIELRFEVMALEQTTTEIISEFESKKLIEDELFNHLKELLSLADYVKFAKGTALPDENEKNMESTYDFVRKTKIVPSLKKDDNEENDNNPDVEPEKDIKTDA